MNRLFREHIHHAGFVFHRQHSFQDNRELAEFGTLAEFEPARRWADLPAGATLAKPVHDV